jgi:hypothetical protein
MEDTAGRPALRPLVDSLPASGRERLTVTAWSDGGAMSKLTN